LTVLLDDFLPFYRFWPADSSRFDPAFLECTRAGHDIWAMGHVHAKINDAEERYFEVISLSKRFVLTTTFKI
jgi:hypothetical protein